MGASTREITKVKRPGLASWPWLTCAILCSAGHVLRETSNYWPIGASARQGSCASAAPAGETKRTALSSVPQKPFTPVVLSVLGTAFDTNSVLAALTGRRPAAVKV